jgi:Tubulin folding cofactor D C terminal
VLTLGLHKCDPVNKLNLLPFGLMVKIIGQIGKQCVEKIDNVRVHAGNAFTALLHYK